MCGRSPHDVQRLRRSSHLSTCRYLQAMANEPCELAGRGGDHGRVVSVAHRGVLFLLPSEASGAGREFGSPLVVSDILSRLVATRINGYQQLAWLTRA